MKPAEHSKLFLRAVFLLHAAVLWCRGLQCLSQEPAHLEHRKSWAPAAVEAPLFSGWRLLLSLPAGQIPHEVK